MHKMLP